MTDEPIDAEAVFDDEDFEATVDGLPVLADVRPVEPVPPAQIGVVQAAAAAATGFVAGAATLALIHHLASRRLAKMQSAVPDRTWEHLPVTRRRTFIVEVHTLGHPAE